MCPCIFMESTGPMHCEQWSLIWPNLPKMPITGAKFFLIVLKLGKLHQHCSWPQLSTWTRETHHVPFWAWPCTPGMTLAQCPCPSDSPSVAQCPPWHMPTGQGPIAISLGEAQEHGCSRHGSEGGQNLFCQPAWSSSISLPVQCCSLCARLAAAFN